LPEPSNEATDSVTAQSLTVTLAPPAPASPPAQEEPPVITHHEITVDGLTLAYTVTAGLMPITNKDGEVEARIFYMAYTKDGAEGAAKRPLMFSFNGGPGSSSVWLHMGALGPKRVAMLDDGNLPPPPYKLVDNEQTWLTETDLVFIDPVGTGFSRAAKPELGKKFFGLKGDIESVGEFIRLYLTRHERGSSPLFLVGESYGTTRAAGLAGHLIDKGIAFNGILLVSTVLNFQTLHFAVGNDLPYVLILPTYAATAWYHNCLASELQSDLRRTLAEVEQWAVTEYNVALARGDALPPAERAKVAAQLSRYTGLSEEYVEAHNLRIEIFRFCKELLRSDKRTVGRLDSRIKGIDINAAQPEPEFDPSMTAIRPPYTSLFNDYVRRDLGWKTDTEYYILGGGFEKWEWDVDDYGFPDTGDALRAAFAKNPYMKLFAAYGFYDLATPYFATMYTLDHLGLETSLRANITTADYESGHMMYIHKPSLEKLKRDVVEFMARTLIPGPSPWKGEGS
jgi:carboxypeptidase C (cathepsin A)